MQEGEASGMELGDTVKTMIELHASGQEAGEEVGVTESCKEQVTSGSQTVFQVLCAGGI